MCMVFICKYYCITYIHSYFTELSDYGSDFIIGINKNLYSIANSLDLHISTASNEIITFHVGDINGLFYTGTVTLNSSTTVNLDVSYMVTDSTYSNRNKGIRVYTEDGGLISVQVVNYGSTFDTVSSYVAYLYEKLYVMQYVYYTVSTTSLFGFTSSLTLLVGTADNTTITITPSHDITIPEDIQNSNSPNLILEAGNSHTITLHYLQTFMFGAANTIDLTGSKIVSDKPLTVVSGHECSNVPANVHYCDATSVQVPPTATWGTKFLLTPHGGRTRGQYYKIVAAESNTVITYNCNNSATVSNVLVDEGAALTFSTPSDIYCYAESNKPVLTVILGTGGEAVGAPVMSMVPSMNSYVYSDILFHIPSYSEFYSHWINIMSTASNPQVLMNGEVLSLSWITINDNNGAPTGYAAQISLSEVGEDNIISSDPPITALVYGWGDYSGFSYTAGVKLHIHQGKLHVHVIH